MFSSTTKPLFMIQCAKHSFNEREISACARVLRNGFLTGGPQVAKFENAFSHYVNAPFSVAVCNGTAALHLACLALKVKPGDEVIVPTVSFVATANAVLYAGAKPVFAAVGQSSGLMNAASIEKVITSKTRGIIVVHYMGQPIDMLPISQLAKKRNLFVIEDACHALGATYRESVIGDCKYSDLSTFSFHPAKNITTGEGGMITTRSASAASILKELRNHGMVRDAKRWQLPKLAAHAYYEVQRLGFNYRLTDFQAAIGIEQIKKLPGFMKTRRKLVAAYQANLKFLPQIQLLLHNPLESGCHLFMIRVREKIAGFTRAELAKELSSKGIATNIHYLPIPLHPFYQKNQRASRTMVENCENFYNGLLTLPLHARMTVQDVREICAVIHAVCKKNRPSAMSTRFKRGKVALRAMSLADLNSEYLRWLNDPSVNRYMARREYDFDDMTDYFTTVSQSKQHVFLAIEDLRRKKHIGNVLLEKKKAGTGILGLMIGDARYHGKGWGRNAVAAACEYGFSKLGLHQIELGALAANQNALRCFVNCGFRVTGKINQNGQAVIRMRLSRGELIKP